ncbi:MAG: S-methyl-5'-thioadenosine phosphorylase, partial [Pseudomonadota bacterium]
GNAEKARGLIKALPETLGSERDACPHGCDRVLDTALITRPEARDAALIAKLDAVAGRVL